MLRLYDHGEVMEIRLARSILGWAPFWARAYLIQGILIDAGPPATGRELAAYLRRSPPDLVVNTHHHEDHSGGDAALSGTLGARVLAPPEALALLGRPPRIGWLRRLIAGKPLPVAAAPLGARVNGRGVELVTVPTPGHSPDHTVFCEPRRRWLFTGDLFLGERTRFCHRDEDVPRSIESLRRAAALEPERLFCSHLGIVEDGAGALRRKIAFWEDLEGKVLDLHRKGSPSREIRDRLLGKEHWIAHLSGGEFSKLNLVRSFLRGAGGRRA